MIDPIDIEAKYLKWLEVSPAASRLAAHNACDTRKVFMQIYHALSGAHVYGRSL